MVLATYLAKDEFIEFRPCFSGIFQNSHSCMKMKWMELPRYDALLNVT